MNNPIATYRFQFHKDFTLADADSLVPYLQKLGVSTVYASPIFQAISGSTHGYDGTNPHLINPEIGTEAELLLLSKKLKDAGIQWLQDIVPNHMAFDTLNPWLMDVLEKGKMSAYANFFDVSWTSDLNPGSKIMVPFLGVTLDEAIQQGDIKIDFDEQRFVLKYIETAYPVNLHTYATILLTGSEPSTAITQLIEQVIERKNEEEPTAFAQQFGEIQMQLKGIMQDDNSRKFVQECLDIINNDHEALRQICNQQVYTLCHWQRTDKRINYRRFFTVNGLLCLNIHEPEVFNHYHSYIKQLVDLKVFNGLRIDHIDGLYDPTTYLHQLRDLVGPDVYIVVEKILEPGEKLLTNWPIQGNTGYDFLALINNVLTYPQAANAFDEFYNKLVNDHTPVHDQITGKKAFILKNYMAGELKNLHHLFKDLTLYDEEAFIEIDDEDVRKAIAVFLIHCPVYRYYGYTLPLDADEAASIAQLIQTIRQQYPELDKAIGLIEQAILQKPIDADIDYWTRATQFYQRCMQFTGPLMAKGVEDTLMYTYNKFIAHNEVGDSPETFGMAVPDFHKEMIERQRAWPLSLNATSTHDTKRGEDVRARLTVLSSMSEDWFALVNKWQDLTKDLRLNHRPDDNDAYFIYQTLVGTYELDGDVEIYKTRLQEYLQKALREAKTNSNWAEPNEEYENAAKQFAIALLETEQPFFKSFETFLKQIQEHTIVNALSQVVLKFTCPGIPDVYQGTELWDLSMVDPDNRRPVDYELRKAWLEEITHERQKDIPHDLWVNKQDAKIKLWLTHTLYDLRRQHADLFAKGEYIPLEVTGKLARHVLAFVRKLNNQWCVVVVPIHTGLIQSNDFFTIDWADTAITLPKGAPCNYLHKCTQQKGTIQNNQLLLAEILDQFPMAILLLEQPINKRGAGVLLHLSSLASPFGIGDMGPEAYRFADFLERSQQKYWQMLPLNPTEAGQGHSPYSATSSRAGNTLFISPEVLMHEGYLSSQELHGYYLQGGDRADFDAATKLRNELFEVAYVNFRQQKDVGLPAEMEIFIEEEKEWLYDFAMFQVLKNAHEGKAWYQWPEAFKKRDADALQKFSDYNFYEIDKTIWLQYIFSRQWKALREYCNGLNIQLIGDLPFYVSYDSADVWSHQELFALDSTGAMTGVAGVPPDAFSNDGQLWGMPVFKWDVLKERNYDWWVSRLKKNMQLFDLVRLDHFRAFADYWLVNAGEPTAIHGKWLTGPGNDFFAVMLEQLGELPFVAEDLGDINDAVLSLRDDWKLPGMNILQFAFGDDMPKSFYIPHNYVSNSFVYTGTHDNNTMRGWYRTELDEAAKQRIAQYAGRYLHEDEVHHYFNRLAYSSVAKTAILPMQDVLGIDENGRMNMPGSAQNNWGWRLIPNQLTDEAQHRLAELVWVFNR